jgi:predicted metal-binding protein
MTLYAMSALMRWRRATKMKRYNVQVCKVVISLTDEFANWEEARDKGIELRNRLKESDSGYNVEYFFEVEELEDEVDE